MGFGGHIWAMTERIGKILIDQFVYWRRENNWKFIKKKKKEKWGSCNYALNVKKINQWLSESIYIIIGKAERKSN